MKTLNGRSDLLEKKEWEASWIHNNVTAKGPHYCYFRKEFNIHGEVESASLDITADRRYKLFVDGIFIGEGPIRSNIHYWSYDTYDISNYLISGEHVLAVVVSQWNPGPEKPLALFVEAGIGYKDGQRLKIVSDTAWKVRNSRAWRSDVPTNIWIGPLQNGYVEYRDLRLEEEGWERASFDDSEWDNASIFIRYESMETVKAYGAKWDYLVARDIPSLSEKMIRPVEIKAAGEIKGTEIFSNKYVAGDHWWTGLENVQPLKKAFIRNTSEFMRGEKEMDLEVCYEGKYFGRILWQPAVIFDFGELVNGYICLDIHGKAGTIIDITYSQTLQDGKVYPVAGGIRRYNRYVLKEGRQRIESFEYVNCRYVQFTVREDAGKGFAGHVNLCGIALRTVEYPVEQKGQFMCSDELLTEVWKSTAITTKLCMNDTFVDNTFREKGCWGGDVSTIILSALTCFGNIDIIKRYLRMFFYEQSQSGVIPCGVPGGIGIGFGAGTIIDHGMAYPIRVWQYYEYTGDIDLLNELYSGLRRYMKLLERYENIDGILNEVPGFIWFDWAELDRRLPSVLLNFYYCIVLLSMAEIARTAGKDEDRIIFESKIKAVKSYSDNFWCEGKGAFPDSLAKSDFGIKISENTNALALLGNITDRLKEEQIIKNVFSMGFDIFNETGIVKSGPPFSIYVLAGLCKAGYHNLALDYIRHRHGSAFEQGLETMPECWIYSSTGETSAAQGTLAAAFILSTEILGIKPLEPGFKTVLISPHPCNLTWAKGAFPSPCGIICVEWKMEEDCFNIRVEIPQGMNGVVEIPFTRNKITVDEHTVGLKRDYSVRLEGNRYYIDITSGSHNIKCRILNKSLGG